MNEDVTISYYTIDNKDYIIVKEIVLNNNKYVYLVNEKDENDLMVRMVLEDELLPLESKEELNKVLENMIG